MRATRVLVIAVFSSILYYLWSKQHATFVVFFFYSICISSLFLFFSSSSLFFFFFLSAHFRKYFKTYTDAFASYLRHLLLFGYSFILYLLFGNNVSLNASWIREKTRGMQCVRSLFNACDQSNVYMRWMKKCKFPSKLIHFIIFAGFWG